MKQQSIVDIIVYLLESVVLQQNEVMSDPTVVKQRLEEAGFSKDAISKAFDWLKELVDQESWCAASYNVKAKRTLRIFSAEESCKISLESRNFILSLEQTGVLDTKMREVVISQLMQLNHQVVDATDTKWVVLFVLMNKSNKSTQKMRSYLLTTMDREI